MNIRPSFLLGCAEDGVVAVARRLGSGALRVVGAASSAAHGARLEYTSRKLAEANVLVDQVNAREDAADRLYIAERTAELIAKKRAAQRKEVKRAARKAPKARRRVVR